MTKKTIIILTCVWGRPEVTEYYIKGLKITQNKLKNVFNFINIIVDSDESNLSLFKNDKTFNYYNYPNQPVSNKWNFALSKCRDFEYDYVLMMGSDDLISPEVLHKYKDFIDSEYEYIGLTDLFVYNTLTEKFYYWSGYKINSGRHGESLGLGRCIRKNIVEYFNYKLWSENLNRGLDGSMEKKMRSLPDLKKINFKCIDYGVSCDIKSENNITKLHTFINQLEEISVDSIHFKFVDDCVSTYNLTIIIPTYNTVEYLEECLNSVIKSIKNLNFQILVGIDNCTETLEYVKNNSFDKRIKFYFFEENVGPYIIKNSLSKLSKSDYILFFDSDDIMKEELIRDVINYKSSKDLIKPMYLDFQKDSKNIDGEILISKTYGEGVFAISAELFKKMNGFKGWRCAADSELMGRLYKNKIKVLHTKRIGLYRRVHKNSLTQHSDTGLFSKLRREYIKNIKSEKKFGPLLEMETFPFIKIDTKEVKIENKNVNLNTDIVDEDYLLKKKKDEIVTKVFSSNSGNKKIQIDYNKIIRKGVFNPSQHKKDPIVTKPKEKPIIPKEDSLTKLKQEMFPSKPNRRNNLPNVFGNKQRRKGGFSI